MNVYIGTSSRLPSTYQEVEYIESSGTQWIDTGITPTQNTKSQIKVLFKEFTGDVVYGMYNSNDNADYRLFNKYDSNINIGKCIFDFGSQRIMSSSVVFSTDTAYELEIGNYYVKNLGTGTNLVSGTTISSYTGSRTITLNYSNNPAISKNRWYYVKIWNGDTQVRDLVPCYRKSDSVIGMYDLVNDQFYTNSGTGTFTKGADVYTNVLQNAYIGEYKGIVFDFQNNGLSGCSINDTSYSGIESGQGIKLYGPNTALNNWISITLPSSSYGKAIKQLILNCYYPTSGYGRGKGFGIQKADSYSFRYSREENAQSYIGFADGVTTGQSIGTITGEITITFNFGDGVISGTVNNTSFSVSNSAANTIRNSFIDGTFRIIMVNRGTTSVSYLRKATIITE